MFQKENIFMAVNIVPKEPMNKIINKTVIQVCVELNQERMLTYQPLVQEHEEYKLKQANDNIHSSSLQRAVGNVTPERWL